MLTARTLSLIEKLQNAPLFSAVGQEIQDVNVTKADSWRHAAKLALSKLWYNVRLEQRNNLTSRLSKWHSKRYQRWNEITRAVDPLLMPTVDAALEGIKPAVKLQPRAWAEFAVSVRVDMGGACHETEYSDISSQCFCQSLTDWYLRGHFPCGWDGNYQSGRLIVF